MTKMKVNFCGVENVSGLTLGFVLLVSGEASAAEATLGASTSEGVSATATAETAPPETVPAADVAAPEPASEPARFVRPERNPDPFDRSARFASVPYLERYRPTGNLWEVGLFTGLFIASRAHNLKVPTLPVENYNRVNFAMGGRLAYFPLSFLGAEAELMMAASATRETEKSALFYSARAHAIAQLPLWSVVPFALFGGGALGAVSESMGHDGDPLLHWGLGLKAPVCEHLSGRFDYRQDLTQRRDSSDGTVTPHHEVLFGLTFTFDRVAPPAPKDSDRDGLFDDEDRCPTEGAYSADGCPVAALAQAPGDRDGDGVVDDVDECPREAGPAPTGCAEKDADGDGVPAPCDACPTEKGTRADGCPVLDGDGDGVLDDRDRCVSEPETKNGFEDDDGCPDTVPLAVKKFAGAIAGISFVKDKAEIDPKSFRALDEAVTTLKEYPSVRIEVSGHTSSEGSAERNEALSVERAEAVKKYLVDHGVEGSRVVSRGAGSSEPVADNATRAGREKNRRIEFRVLDQGR